MSVSDTSQNIMEVISPILDEYIKWYGAALSGLLKNTGSPISNPAGSVLKNFLTTLSNDHFITNRRAASLLESQEQMQISYQKESEDVFIEKYQNFFLSLRALERDCVLEDNGLDYLTGLNSKSVLIRDIEKELERLSRKGQAFSMALIQIEQYDDILSQMSDTSSLQNTRKVAELVKDSIRSFDEAYRSGPGEFFVLLKQADISGGLAALARLRNNLEKEEITIELQGKEVPLSLSCCVAEPVEQDVAEDLLKNLRSDLKKGKGKDNGQGQILEYHEISPLQRYLQEEKDA